MPLFSMSKNIIGSLFRKRATLDLKTSDPTVRGHIEIEENLCILCGICQKKCPTSAIEVKKEDKCWAIKPFYCVQCGCCVEVCPKKCLRMESGVVPPDGDKDVVKDARIPVGAADN